MEGDGLGLWLQRQLKPLFKGLSSTAAGWASLAVSLLTGSVLYGAYERPWLGLIAVPMLAVRLSLDSLKQLSVNEAPVLTPYSRMMSGLCDRLADISLFLGLTFWPPDVMRVHLAMLALICMLIVSYVGECARSTTGCGFNGGFLCRSHRIVLLMLFSTFHALRPGAVILGFSTFEVMFALFIPLASLTLLQRMEAAISKHSSKDN